MGLSPLTWPDQDDLFLGLELFENSDSLGPFDAVLAAIALRQAWALASADRSFVQVDGLVFLDPESTTFLEDIRSAG